MVTGAGRGIGRAIATQLADAGASVLLNDLDESALCETERALSGDEQRVAAVAGDLTEPSFPDALVNAALDRFGDLDIIVNNAGYSWDSVIQKTTDEQFQAMLDIHLVVPFRIMRAAATHIRAQAKSEIADGRRVMRKVVNITSIAGTDGNPGQAGYAAGKAGVIGLTKTLAKEWGRYNVNVNAVGFGMIETRLVQPLGGSDAYIRHARPADRNRGPAEPAGIGAAEMSAGPSGDAGGSRRRRIVLLLSAVRLCHGRGADLWRRLSLLISGASVAAASAPPASI